MSEAVDMVAVSRVASRVDLLEVNLVRIRAERSPAKGGGTGRALEASFQQEARPLRWNGGLVEIECSYQFGVMSSGEQVARAEFSYSLLYSVEGTAAIDEEDAKQFATLNGPYNSWPFARTLLFDLTARMGLPTYVLPAFSVMPPRPPAPPEDLPSGTELPALARPRRKRKVTARRRKR